MDWDDLRIFLSVSRTESLSGAGRRLGMDASTIGRRIARLERAVGQRQRGHLGAIGDPQARGFPGGIQPRTGWFQRISAS